MPRLYYIINISFRNFAVFLLFSVFIISFFSSQSFAAILDPQADLYRRQGLEEQQKGRYTSALNFYLKALSLGQDSPILYNDIGVIYEQLGKADRAEQYYLHVLKVDANYLPAYSNLAYLYMNEGYNEKAKQYFWERLKRSSGDDPWRDRIRREIYRLDPDFKAKAIRMELEEEARRLQEMEEKKQRQEFILSVQRAEHHYRRGEMFRSKKSYKKAVNEFDQALRITPDNPKVLKAKELTQYDERMDEINDRITVATDKLKTGEVDSAKKEFQQILAIIPKESVQ